MTNSNTPDTEIEITDFATDGDGLGIAQNGQGQSIAVQIPFACPGDRVLVQLRKRKINKYRSNEITWLSLSKARSTPRCVHFGKCGGCRWQHIPYQEQLQQKERLVKALLQAHFNKETVFHPIIACDPPWHYRNKLEFSFSSDKAGKRYLGLILFNTRGHVFQLTECHLGHPWMVEALNATTKWWVDMDLEAYHPMHDTGALRTLTVRCGERTGDRMVILTVSGNADYALTKQQLQTFVAMMRQNLEEGGLYQLSIVLRIQQVAKKQPTQFYEMILYGKDHILEELNIDQQKIYLQVSPTAFLQPNTRQAEKLYSHILQALSCDDIENKVLFDLYCGTGTLGLCLAHRVKKVIGIELVPESVLDAKENIKHNQRENIVIYQGDVGAVLNTLQESPPDIVLVDPPRAGLDLKAISNILALKAKTLVYVSCNPNTQAANLIPIIENGYKLKTVQPVDQFPHTLHVENIVVLTKV